ncbi:MAG: AAA family ATPase [Burkholderiales bacterium]|nr:AAA family ATPase [Burkholderiales bacterium]
MRTFVIVSGLPASGKSTLASRLAGALSLPVLDKDTILESIFQSVEVADPEQRRRLSRQADLALQQAAWRQTAAILVSWWRHPRSMEPTGTPIDWLKVPGQRVIEVHVVCRPEVAADRFLLRRRHAGHQDDRWSRETLLALLSRQAPLGPLFPDRAIRILDDASDPVAHVAAGLRRWLVVGARAPAMPYGQSGHTGQDRP